MESKLSNGTTNGSENPSEFKIPVPWGEVCGKWWGPRDKQPIIAIHGWQDNAGTWDTLAPLLPSDISLLCIDLPGHGLSSHYPPGLQYYLFWDGLILIRRIVKQYNWSKITLMGHSLGGALSFLYAATYPDDVNKYISIDIASPSVRDMKKIVLNTGDAIDSFLKYENLTEDKIPCYSYDEMVDLAFNGYGGSITRESCKIMMRRGMNEAPPHLHKSGYHFSRDVRLKVSRLGMFSIDHVMEYASKITCKVLNIKACPGMKWENPSYYQMVLDKIQESAEELRYFEVEGTHHVHLNNPERVVNHIVDFLKN